MLNVVEQVKDKIQKPILTAKNYVIISRMELAVRPMNKSSGRHVVSVTANSERGEQMGNSTPYGNVFHKNSTFR